MKRTLESRKIDQLKNHRFNAEVFGEINPAIEDDAEFIDSLKRFGIMEPLTVCPDNTIISGHRRRQGAGRAGLKEVPVVVRLDLKSQQDVDRAWFEANRHREKTTEQKARWFAKLREMETQSAENRQKAGKNGGSDLRANLPQGRAADIAAAEVGMSRRTAEAAVEVVEAIDEAESAGDSETASDLRKTLNKSVAAAAAKVNGRVADDSPAVVKDKLGREIPKHLSEKADAAPRIRSAASKFDAVVKLVNEIAAEPGGEFLQVAEILDDIKAVKGKISHSRYFTDCPKCCGKVNAKCKRCSGAGFIPFRMRGMLSADEKEWLGI